MIRQTSDRELLRLTAALFDPELAAREEAIAGMAEVLRLRMGACAVAVIDLVDPSRATLADDGSLDPDRCLAAAPALLADADTCVHRDRADLPSDSAVQRLLDDGGFDSATARAWREHDELTGGIVVLHRDAQVPNPADLADLESVGALLGPAVAWMRRERVLTASHRRLARAEEIAGIGTWELDIPSGRMSWSDAVYRIFGIDPAEGPLEGKAAFRLNHPDDEAMVRELARRALADGEGYDVEHRIVRDDGEQRWIRAVGEVSLDTEGRPERIVAVTQDITERRALVQESERGQRLESLGRLASGIAHDFNNLLTVIMGNAELLAMESGTPDAELDEILAASERAKALVARILLFGRGNRGAPTSVDFGSVIESAAQLLRAALTAEVDLRVVTPADRLHVRADPVDLTQLILNLATNAQAAMPDGGTLQIELEAAPGSDGETARLTVRDTGRGIPYELIPVIFDPYFTTREIGQGTGLGLAIVHGIITRMRGEIRVESTLGVGTTFTIDVPTTPPAATVAPASRPAVQVAMRRERVLVVDDDPAVLRTLALSLGSLGYEVDTCSSAVKALDLLASGPAPALVFTDHQMPGRSGVDLALEIRDSFRLPVVLCTGWPDEQVRTDAAAAGVVAILEKPIRRSEVARVVRDALDGAKR